MLNFTDIFNLNQIERDGWVRSNITKHFAIGSKVLDVGAGTSPYKNDLLEHQYMAHDFGQYQGIKLDGTYDYGDINIQSDILNIPLQDGEIDNILCTEVLEHVPRPIEAIGEFSRLLKAGGKAIITTPFTSGVHQEPYHFYSGFSPYFYQFAAKEFDFNLIEITPHGGFLRLMAQELGRINGVYSSLTQVGFTSTVANLNDFLLMLANELFLLDKQIQMSDFSIGYHVVLEKK
jgi:SAM-dependent methyltransferase